MRRAVSVLVVLVALGVGGVLVFQEPPAPVAADPVLEGEPVSGDAGVARVEPVAVPRTRELLVRTRLGGEPFDIDLEVSCHGHARTSAGEVVLRGLQAGECVVRVARGELTAAEQRVELTEPRTTVELELRKSAWLTVKVSAARPVERVEVDLSNEEVRLKAAPVGSIDVGPVPEGDYDVRVTSEGLVPVEREVSLAAGQNTLEAVLREPTRLRGLVVDERGERVAGARVVAIAEGQPWRETWSGDGGVFEVPLLRPGEVRLRAERLELGTVELRVLAPKEDVVLMLAARGVLEVDLFDVDGTPLPAELYIKPTWEAPVRTTVPKAPGVVRIAGLEKGTYVIERQVPRRMPIEKRVEIVEGQVTRVTLREELGVRITGRVIDHLGHPAQNMLVGIERRDGAVRVDEDGRFEWEGLAPGKVRLYAFQGHELTSNRLEVEAPASNVILKLESPARVSGRVVDQRGRPVREFEANGQLVEDAKGRFDVKAPYGTLEVFADGYAPFELDGVEGEVGDVVLEPERFVEGVVVDEAGRPVAGASVSALGVVGVLTDAKGHFRFALRFDDAFVTATRGAAVGHAVLSTREPVRVVLQRGTHVVGRVLDAWGRGLRTTVFVARGLPGRRQEVMSDVTGRFEVDLPSGPWLFSSEVTPEAQVFEVQGERVQVTLGQ